MPAEALEAEPGAINNRKWGGVMVQVGCAFVCVNCAGGLGRAPGYTCRRIPGLLSRDHCQSGGPARVEVALEVQNNWPD